MRTPYHSVVILSKAKDLSVEFTAADRHATFNKSSAASFVRAAFFFSLPASGNTANKVTGY